MYVGLYAILFWMRPRAATATTNFTVPSTWQGTDSNMSRSAREGLANSAAAALVSLANPSSESPYYNWIENHASAFAVLSLQDYYSGNTTWADVVTNGIQAFNKQYGLYGNPQFASDAIYWGLVFFYAYRTYQQDVLLDLAISAYETTYDATFITEAAAASDTGAGRDVSFAGCTDATVAGGVFYLVGNRTDTYVNGESVSPFLTLSAYLYEHTKNATYAQAARLSLDFVLNHMWNGTIVYDAFDTHACAVNDPIGLLTSDQGWFIEGLSVWANITNNQTLTNILEAIVSNATTRSDWSLPNGVIVESPGPNNDHVTLKGIFIRALAEARARNPSTDLAQYIEAYALVQFNSILENARSPAPNDSFYSITWFGQPYQLPSAIANIAAIDVLNTAFSFVAPSNSSAGNATSTVSAEPSATSTSGPSQHSDHSQAGSIAGGVVGGVVAIFVVAMVLIIALRRRARTRDDGVVESKANDTGVGNGIEPFNLPASDTGVPSKWHRYYSSDHGQGVGTGAITTFSPSGDIHSDRNEQGLVGLAADDSTRVQETNTESDEHLIAEIPTLVQRLNTLWQRRGDVPPAYEG
ncbi:unnamed protein product [Peniophora sp. CBMAI 1063]|nr:unnamed protein product [Peniophora sp. CBMAI 1063]